MYSLKKVCQGWSTNYKLFCEDYFATNSIMLALIFRKIRAYMLQIFLLKYLREFHGKKTKIFHATSIFYENVLWVIVHNIIEFRLF